MVVTSRKATNNGAHQNKNGMKELSLGELREKMNWAEADREIELWPFQQVTLDLLWYQGYSCCCKCVQHTI
jgi:hypothetical protein